MYRIRNGVRKKPTPASQIVEAIFHEALLQMDFGSELLIGRS
jgi:hypothetical protein